MGAGLIDDSSLSGSLRVRRVIVSADLVAQLDCDPVHDQRHPHRLSGIDFLGRD